MKIKLPNTDKVHRCPGCHSIFNIYYTNFGSYNIGNKTYHLRTRLIELLPLYHKECGTLKLPMIWSISVWKSHRQIKKWNREIEND